MPHYSLISEMNPNVAPFAAIELRDCPRQGEIVLVPGAEPRTFSVGFVFHVVGGDTLLFVQDVRKKPWRLV